MKYLVVLSFVATCAYAQVGQSGIIDPSGRNIQFTHDFAHNIALIGPSGIVSADGKNVQLTHGQADLHNARKKRSPQVGASGIIDPSGKNIQFSHAFADNVAVIGPSGIVSADGNNVQLTHGQADLHNARKKRSPQVGASGIIDPSGRNIQFSHAFADKVALIGPSGIVSADGNNVQLTHGQADLHNARRKRSPQLLGPSGYISADGQQRQFKTGGVEVLLDGPSGIVLGDGQLIQKRSKRSAFGIHHGAQIGAAQFVTPAGVPHLLNDGTTVAAAGPSGIVLTNGQHIQYPARKKRSAAFGIHHGAQIGSAQFVTPAGVPHLLNDGTTVAAAGPSGIVLTNGQHIQYPARKKRSAAFGIHHGAQIGSAQFVTPAGVPHLLNDGTTVAAAGPSGIVLTNGQHIQYPARKKRSAAFGIHHGAQIGSAQFVTPDGVPHLLNDGTTVAAAGPSGIVLTNGQHIQYQ